MQKRKLFLTLGAITVILSTAFYGAVVACAPNLQKYEQVSYVLYDNKGNVIYEEMAEGDYHRIETTQAEVDPIYIKMLLAAEDERFYYHPGVDPISIGRAIISNLTSGKRVSGASTIAMQVCRMLEPKERNLLSKIKEALGAIYLVTHYGHDQVLNMYLTLAPFGGNLEGVSAASYRYFGHSPKVLTPAQAALLVALPRAPESMRPDRYPLVAKYFRNEVLKKATSDEVIKADLLELATVEPIAPRHYPIGQITPHLGQTIFQQLKTSSHHALLPQTLKLTNGNKQDSQGLFVYKTQTKVKNTGNLEAFALEFLHKTQELYQKQFAKELSNKKNAESKLEPIHLPKELRSLHTTIDPNLQFVLQKELDQLNLPNEENLAVVIVDHRDFSLKAYVGSLSYLNSFVDAAQAIRSPGSTLKPFAYIQAFEQGLLHPNSILLDYERLYNTYQPRNYDRTFFGEVSIAQALRASLNLPALETMKAIGPENFVNQINSNPYGHPQIYLQEGTTPSLGVILGGCSISLVDLTLLYATLAQDGRLKPLTIIDEQKTRNQINPLLPPLPLKDDIPVQMYNIQASRAVYNILEDMRVPLGFNLDSKISYKTGTSYKYRDTWVVGSKDNLTIGIWSGRNDGRPSRSIAAYQKLVALLFSLVEQLPREHVNKPYLTPSGSLTITPPPALRKVRIAQMGLAISREHKRPTKLNTSQGEQSNLNNQNSFILDETIDEEQTPLEIKFPQDGMRLSGGYSGKIFLNITGGSFPYIVFIDGKRQEQSNFFTPDHSGIYDIMVIDQKGQSVKSQVLIE